MSGDFQGPRDKGHRGAMDRLADIREEATIAFVAGETVDARELYEQIMLAYLIGSDSVKDAAAAGGELAKLQGWGARQQTLRQQTDQRKLDFGKARDSLKKKGGAG